MKKIILLSTNQAVTPYPVPPLGLALLYHVLQEKFNVKLIDGFGLNKRDLQNQLKEFKPDYIGISIRNIDDMVKGAVHSFIPYIESEFIKTIHKHSDARLILGGAGFTIFPQELMTRFQADYGIIGEAERSLPQLLEALANGGKDPLHIDGVISKGSSSQTTCGTHISQPQQFQADLDLLLNYSKYSERGAYPIQTKRGCTHRCIYCSYPILEGRTFRKRHIGQVVDEIEATCNRFDDPELVFEFVDSTFNDPPGHAEAICTEIIKRGLKVNLRTMGMNPVNITDNLLVLMKEAGFSQIDSTPDSASGKMLKNYGKNFTINHLEQAAKLIRSHEMPTMWFFIFGGPGETEETLLQSLDFIDRFIFSDDMVHITEGLRIYPKTPLAQLAAKEGVIREDQSLLSPVFYVSPLLGETQLSEIITREIANRPNCIRLTDTRPPPELMQLAMRERAEKRLKEPMFRTLLRLKRQLYSSDS